MCDHHDPPTIPDTPEGREAARLHHLLRSAIQCHRAAVHTIAHLLADLRQSRLYRELGYASLTEYAESEFGYLPGKTQQLARVGERLADLPLLDAALARGALGWTKIRTVVPVATPETEQDWLNAATSYNSRELEELAQRACPGAPPPTPDPGDLDPALYAWATIRFEPHHYELLMRAATKLRQRYGNPDLSLSQLLLELAERELQRNDNDDVVAPPRGENATHENYRIIEHRCPACDRAWTETRAGRQELHPHARALVECDAQILDATGGPRHGHLTRTIPPATRRAVLVRDHNRCQVPGCRNHRHLDLHHIRPRAQGGTHDPDNLVTLCSTHHDLIHRGVIRVTRDQDNTLSWSRPGEPLAHILKIAPDRVEIDHSYLGCFTGPAGSWYMLDSKASGMYSQNQSRSSSDDETVHVNEIEPADTRETVHVNDLGIEDRFPRGWQVFRPGDESDIGNSFDFPSWPGR